MRLRIAITTAAAALALAAPAQADDASVFAAYNSHQAELDAGLDAYRAAWAPIEKNRGWRTVEEAQALIDADGQINEALKLIATDVQAQQPSTEAGAKAHKLTLREIRLWQLSNSYEAKAFALAIEDRMRESDRAMRQCERAYKRYGKTVRLTKRAWKKAGFQPPKYSVGG